ncbi:MAG: Nif3-like dinuclear metal center hexameric protein [Leptolyngbyaceae cyanobacterium T60_A2020_046]|nr:Nif3-like dinuclear metal center hexameric protein [Leptolyngbyaceae cyanobacterium T60_A2020_046]
MTIATVIEAFESWAPPHWQEKWDNCGWQVEPGVMAEPAGVLVCLTPTLAVMQEAIALRQSGVPVNLIFAHHPLIFHPLKSVRGGRGVGELVRLSFQHGIGVYTAHTNFDQVAQGTADVLAQRLELQDTEPVVATQSAAIGYGRVGKLPSPLTLRDFLVRAQAALTPPDLIYSPEADLEQSVKRVAVLGGSGASFIDDVVETGAQVYLTSDCKFHQFQEARDRGLVLVDAGHYATERPACADLVPWFQRQGVQWVGLSDRDEDFRQFFQPNLIHCIEPDP